jgi:steroid delta-isomerase-like uncharacterized protein
MSEANKATARRFYDEFLNKGDTSVVDAVCTPNVVIHAPPSPPGIAPGTEGLKQMIGMYRTAFPDFHVTVDEMVSEGDVVVVRMTFQGTHTGDLMGIPPTGNKINIQGVDFLRFVGGKAAEVWHHEEELLMWQQLGVAPPME